MWRVWDVVRLVLFRVWGGFRGRSSRSRLDERHICGDGSDCSDGCPALRRAREPALDDVCVLCGGRHGTRVRVGCRLESLESL